MFRTPSLIHTKRKKSFQICSSYALRFSSSPSLPLTSPHALELGSRLMPVGGSDMMLRLDLVSSDGLPTPAPLSPCVQQWSSKEFYCAGGGALAGVRVRWRGAGALAGVRVRWRVVRVRWRGCALRWRGCAGGAKEETPSARAPPLSFLIKLPY